MTGHALPRSSGKAEIAVDVAPVMQIREAARATGATPRSLRFYEAEGLIRPGRCANGYRDYCECTVDRVRVIRSLLERGLPTVLIQRLVDNATATEALGAKLEDAAMRADVERYREKIEARVEALTARLSALDGFLDGADRS